MLPTGLARAECPCSPVSIIACLHPGREAAVAGATPVRWRLSSVRLTFPLLISSHVGARWPSHAARCPLFFALIARRVIHLARLPLVGCALVSASPCLQFPSVRLQDGPLAVLLLGRSFTHWKAPLSPPRLRSLRGTSHHPRGTCAAPSCAHAGLQSRGPG